MLRKKAKETDKNVRVVSTFLHFIYDRDLYYNGNVLEIKVGDRRNELE